MATDVEVLLERVITSLRAHEDVSVEEVYVSEMYDIGEEISQWSPQGWTMVPAGFESLARSLARDYPLFGRVEMRWRSISDPAAGGESVTPDLPGLNQARIPADAEHPDLLEAAGEDIYVLDDHPHTGDGCVLGASLTEPRLWAVSLKSGVAQIPVGLDVLQRAVLDMRGSFHWQWLFVDPEGLPGRRELAITVQKTLTTLDRLWPDWDDGRYSTQRAKWAAVEARK